MASIGRVLLIPKGDYSSSVTYNNLDWVRYNGKAWVCKVDGTVNVTPVQGDTWQLLAQDGSGGGGGASDWDDINYKPFETLETTTDFSVDGNDQLHIKRGTFGTVRVVSDSSGSPTTTDLEASGDAIITLKGGTNVTLSADDSSNPKKITINSSGGGGGGTVTSIATGAGLTGGSPAITTSGTIKCNLKSETASANASENVSTTAGRQYAVTPDSNNKLSVNVPWTDTHDIWSSSAQVDSSNQVTFDDLDNSYGYDLYCDDKLIGISAMTKTTGTNTGIKLVYTVTGASQGDTCYLRILR